MAEEQKWLNTAEASKLLGITGRHVRRLDGLEFKKEGKNLLVSLESVEASLRKQGSDSKECPTEDFPKVSNEALEIGDISESGEDIPDEEDDMNVEESDAFDGEDVDVEGDADIPDEEDADFEEDGDLPGEDDPDIPPAINQPLPDIPADLTELSRRLRTGRSNVRESVEMLFDTADMTYRWACFERRRSDAVQNHLQELMAALSIQPKSMSRWMKLRRKFIRFLPWALFGISTVVAYLLWS